MLFWSLFDTDNTEPTRPNVKTHSKSTLIDRILCNKSEKICASDVFELGVWTSDHCPVAWKGEKHSLGLQSQPVQTAWIPIFLQIAYPLIAEHTFLICLLHQEIFQMYGKLPMFSH